MSPPHIPRAKLLKGGSRHIINVDSAQIQTSCKDVQGANMCKPWTTALGPSALSGVRQGTVEGFDHIVPEVIRAPKEPRSSSKPNLSKLEPSAWSVQLRTVWQFQSAPWALSIKHTTEVRSSHSTFAHWKKHLAGSLYGMTVGTCWDLGPCSGFL